MVVWNFHYRLVPTGTVAQLTVKAKELHVAATEFHALLQLARGYHRDSYAIDHVISNHSTEGSATPQSYTQAELPERNPDAKGFELSPTLRRKIYPDADNKEKAG